MRHRLGHSVVSYRNSTSNHNGNHHSAVLNGLYLIEILHQTTTRPPVADGPLRCILSKFYIKPQRCECYDVWRLCCILSKFYIKPQHHCYVSWCFPVVSYRNSTSNHNSVNLARCMAALYLIEILHQTTTSSRARARLLCCILSKFYIKPQLRRWRECHYVVVSYRNSTSNHNTGLINGFLGQVVSYRNSTSNHNLRRRFCVRVRVVSYRNSTSNHNYDVATRVTAALYLIEILHQTTTGVASNKFHSASFC